MGYAEGQKFLLCQVLAGRNYKCPGLCMGVPLKEGYDSHNSPNDAETVIFDVDQILPYYVVYYQSSAHTYTRAVAF